MLHFKMRISSKSIFLKASSQLIKAEVLSVRYPSFVWWVYSLHFFWPVANHYINKMWMKELSPSSLTTKLSSSLHSNFQWVSRTSQIAKRKHLMYWSESASTYSYLKNRKYQRSSNHACSQEKSMLRKDAETMRSLHITQQNQSPGVKWRNFFL